MLVLSWNIHGSRGIHETTLGRQLDALASMGPDIVLLQEVAARWDLPDEVRGGLRARGFGGFFYSGDPLSDGKRYGNVIASRWPLRAVRAGWARDAPWPQLLARATVTVDGTDVEVISAHMPNGAGNGWKKIYTFEALSTYLRDTEDMPRVVGGDFNEPRFFEDDGKPVSFGARKRAKGTFAVWGDWTRHGVKHPRFRWDEGVRSVLGGEATHGLRHAFLARHGLQQVTTHLTRRSERFFDHVVVSKHFEIVDAGYKHNWRLPGADGEGAMSDHSAAWAEVTCTRALGSALGAAGA